MTCDDYLAMLSTASIAELEIGPRGRAPARCSDCARVTRLVAERERHRVAAFDELRSATPAYVTSDVAIASSRGRRRLDGVSGLALAMAVMGVVWFVTPLHRLVVRAEGLSTPMVEEAFLLRCMTPAEAAELTRPYLRTKTSSMTITDRAPGVLTVRASPAQMQIVRSVIDRNDGTGASACPARPGRRTRR
jgi:hypothetical protein